MRKTRMVLVVAVAGVVALAAAAPAHGVNFVVDSTLDVDDGAAPNNGCQSAGLDECTMREAILAANASAGTDGIFFAGSLPNGTIIPIATALPQITEQVNIGNGSGFIKVELNGPGPSGGTTPGLEFTAGASNSTLSIVSIVDFDRGVMLDGADGVTIESTRIGVTAAGTADGNGNTLNEGGIRLIGDADNNTISSSVISANAGDGINTGPTADNTTITGNTIGTDLAGSTTLGNGANGIDLGEGSGATVSGGVIGNNAFRGIIAAGPATSIKSASIGLSGSTDVGNGGEGILVAGPTAVATIGGTGVTDGNTIAGNGGNGVALGSAAGGSVLQRNSIGTDSSGNASADTRNGGGVLVQNSPANLIGTPGAGNRIANNNNEGVQILNADGNRVEANLVGLGFGGPPGNVLNGIRVGNDADANVIGSPGAGNTIGGNGANGILVEDATTAGTIVQANVVGFDASGNPEGNASDGIAVNQAAATVVGGLGAGEGNVSSGNDGDGIDARNGSDDTVIRGNSVGTNGAGTLAIPNFRGLRVEGDRVVVEGNSIAGNITEGASIEQGVDFRMEGNRIGQSVSGATMGNGGSGVEIDDVTGTIGGPGAAANTITGNLSAGIGFDNDDARVTIGENSIFGNGGLGIDLDLDIAGATPNDPGDPDVGANTLQNAPGLTSTVLSGGQTAVTGTINTNASTPVVVRLFASSACDPSGAGEGQRSLGTVAVATDGSGNGSFAATLPATTAGEQITATATGPGGTSEFSPCRAVETPGPGVATITPGTASVAEGGRATFTVTRSGSTAQDALVFVASADGSAKARDDYDPIDTAVFFNAGEATKSVSVATRDDKIAEGNETLTVALSAPVRVGLGTPASATLTITGNDRVPDSSITKVKSPVAATKLKTISGRASDADGDLTRVEVAIFRKTGRSCRNISTAGRERRKAATRGRCLPTLFLRARGTTRWSFRLPRSLPKGTWTVVARAVDRGGHRETTFDARDRNRVGIRVT